MRERARALVRAAEKKRLRRAARSVQKVALRRRNAAPPSRLERATGLTPPMLTVALLVMFTSAGFGMVLPFLPLYAEDLGASPVLIGLMVSAFAVGSGAASLAGGVVADRAGRKRSLTLGMLLFGVATLLLAFVRKPATFVALRALEGAGFGLIYPAANALAQDHAPPERLGRALGAYGTVTLLGSFLGPAAGGLLAGRFGYAGTFLIVAGLALAGAALVPGLVKEAPADLEKENLERQEGGGGRLEPQPRAFPWSKLLIAAYLAGGVIYLNNGLVQVTEVLYFSNELGADTETLGLLFTLMAFGTLVARYPAGSLVDRVGATPVLVGGLVLSGLFSAAIVLMPGVWAAAGVGRARRLFRRGRGVHRPRADCQRDDARRAGAAPTAFSACCPRWGWWWVRLLEQPCMTSCPLHLSWRAAEASLWSQSCSRSCWGERRVRSGKPCCPAKAPPLCSANGVVRRFRRSPA